VWQLVVKRVLMRVSGERVCLVKAAGDWVIDAGAGKPAPAEAVLTQ
jgi:hypothetical protein